MLTFEQLKPVLFKWATHYCGMGFEVWELINETWLMGDVQKLDDIRLASRAVRCDMVDYIRDQTFLRRRQKWEELGLNFPEFTPISTFFVDTEDGLCFSDTISTKPDYDRLESKDLFVFLTKGFTSTEKLIVRLRYERDFTMLEIAEAIGCAESCVSQLHTGILKRIKVKLLDMGIVGRDYTKPYKYQREPDNLRFYNRTYYQENKVDIQRRRAKKRRKTA